MQAWIDDSGAKGQGRWMTLGGLTGSAEEWAAFSDRWDEELHREPRLAYLSASDAANLSGQFYRWPSWQRDAKVRRLVNIANDFRLTVLCVSIELSIFASLKERLIISGPEPPAKSPIPKRRRTMSEEPYFFLLHNACSAICVEMLGQGVNEEIDLFFDEQDVMKPRIREWYPMYLAALEGRERAIMPSDLIFRDDKKFMPLQMADFVAWVERAEVSNTEHPFRDICKGLRRIRRSRYSGHWTAERFERLIRYEQGHALTQHEEEYGAKLREYLGFPNG